MKLTVFLLTAAFLNVSAKGVSQNVSLTVEDASLASVFQIVQQQTGYAFLYTDDVLRDAKPVSLRVDNLPLEQFLHELFEDQPIAYSVSVKSILLSRKSAAASSERQPKLSGTDNLFNELINIRGRVLNEQGEPVAGVSVQVKGNKNIGTYTDEDGEFLLGKIESTAILVFTGVNIQTIETSVNGRRILDIRVKGKTGKLDEVQVIAYGKTSQRFTTGNQTTVKSEDIEKQPINNPLLSLQGRVPGLVVSQANGVPGGGITIRIQGRNNLDNSLVGSDPFIVIDGIPYASQNLSTFRGGGTFPILGSSSDDGINSMNSYGNPLAFINPADIESITVLRDADATAIYGSRAANGAILITTRKGKPGRMKTDVNLQHGWGQVPKKMDLLNSQQYLEMRREAKRNDGRPINSTDFDLRGIWDTARYTDWQDELIGGTAGFTRLTAGVSGGTSNLQFLVSTTYGRETTVFPGDFANTFGSLHFSISATSANQRFKLQLGGNYMANTNKLPAEDYTALALNLPPVAPALYNSDGSLNWAPDPLTGSSTWFNPLSRQYHLFETKTNNLVSNGSLSYQILPSLELKSTFGFTSTTSDQFIAPLDETEKPENRANRFRTASFTFNTSRTWIVEPQLAFQQKWGYHNLTLLTGSTFQYQNNNGRAFFAAGHSSDLLLKDMLAGTSFDANGTDVNEYRYNAVFGRISYTLKSRYLVNLTARRDGSSRFGPNNRFNNFGAVGLGWILTEEAFFKRILSKVSFAKLRGSYGSTGNDQIGNYRFMSLYRSFSTDMLYQGLTSSEAQALPNPYLEWEETHKLQGGIDLGFWKDRFLLTVNFYRNRTSNSLTNLRLPIVTGFGTLVTNLPALIQNTGWEFSLSSTNINAGNFRWSSSLNFTIPRNKLVSFPDLATSPMANRLVIGQPLNITKTSFFYGVDPMTGLYLIANRHGDPVNTSAAVDQTNIINSSARWYGGFQNNLSYKNISLDFLIQFNRRFANDALQLSSIVGRFLPGAGPSDPILGNQPTSVLNRWQKPGDQRAYQKFSTGSLGTGMGDLFYRNVSFARIKNLAISYLLTQNFLQKIKLQELRIYVNAQNLFTLTQYNGLDPETLNTGSLPPLRIITFGIKAIF